MFNLTGYRFILYKEKGQKEELVSSRNKTLASYGLKHGDMIYMTPVNEALIWSSKPETVSDKISLPGTSGI